MMNSGELKNGLRPLTDCALVFITAIVPSAAARVTRNKIMPIKVEMGTGIKEQLDRLLLMLQNKPPLWLAKIMKQNNHDQEEVV